MVVQMHETLFKVITTFQHHTLWDVVNILKKSDDAHSLDIVQMVGTVTVVYMCRSRMYKLRSSDWLIICIIVMLHSISDTGKIWRCYMEGSVQSSQGCHLNDT
jgi:hypothetical protein